VTHAIRKHLGDFIAILALMAIAIGIAGYILTNQRLRLPLLEDAPFRVKVELPDAQAVQPGQGQTVRVAGVKVGDIGKVEADDGVAVVELQLDAKYEGLVRKDATALLRTKTGLKDMFLEVDPGDGKPLKEGERLPVRNSQTDIDPDEILAGLDADTRDYLKLLIAGGGKGLDEGGGEDLRETFKRFEPLHRDLAQVTEAVARRRANLKRLVHNYGLLTTELATKDREIVRLVRESERVFDAFASEDQNISSFVSKLPGALRTTEGTLAKVDTLGDRLGPSLESLRPAFRKLDDANRAVLPFVREARPIVRNQIRPFTRVLQPNLVNLGLASRDLNAGNPDLATSFEELNRFFNMGAYNPGGAEPLTGNLSRDRARNEGYLYWLGWVAQVTVSLFNTSDAQGPWRRLSLGGISCSTFTARGLPAPIVGLLQQAKVCAG
jgi:phospholipid/cholesterol/gamma-HCH transport system substrate-binding protein